MSILNCINWMKEKMRKEKESQPCSSRQEHSDNHECNSNQGHSHNHAAGGSNNYRKMHGKPLRRRV